MARQKPTRSNIKRPGLRAAASDLAVNYSHLRRVVIGDRSSVSLMTRFRNWMNTTPKAGMNENPPNKTRIPKPPEFAAAENLMPKFFSILDKFGLQIIVVRFEAGIGSPVWQYDKIQRDLDQALRAVHAGEFDSSFFTLGAQYHFFHVRNLALAMQTLKTDLDAHGLLKISRIYHAESAEEWVTWFPPTAERVNTDADADS